MKFFIINILTLMILSSLAFAINNYYIQLGSFKNIELLKKSLHNIPYSLFQNIKVVKYNEWYIIYTINKQSYDSVTQDIELYKKYFKKAIISNSKIVEKYKPLDLDEILNTKTEVTKNEEKKIKTETKKKSLNNEYYIQLGSFKNKKTLKDSLEKIPSKIVKNITVMKQDQWYIPMVVDKKSYSSIVDDIFIYKKYFKDAISTKSKTLDKNKFINFDIEDNKAYSSFNRTKELLKIRRNLKIKLYKRNKNVHILSFKKNIKNRIFYMAYKSKDKNSSLLIKLSFKKNVILYKPIINDLGLRKANYMIKNNKLFMYTNALNISSIHSTLDEKNEKFMLISSWDNKKKVSSLRYYFKLTDAKEYLGVALNTSISRMLEDNEFVLRLRTN